MYCKNDFDANIVKLKNSTFSSDAIKACADRVLADRACIADATLFNFSPDHLLQPECLSSKSAESIPPQRLHGSRAMQPVFVWFSRSLSAQKSRQRRLLASEPPEPQY